MLNLTAIVLTGGISERYFNETGVKKQFASIQNKPQIYWIISDLIDSCQQVLISVKHLDDIEIYNSILNEYFKDSIHKLEIIPDMEFSHEIGPVAGLLSCYSFIKSDYCLITPIDTPLANRFIISLSEKFKSYDISCHVNSEGFFSSLNFYFRVDSKVIENFKSLITLKLNKGLQIRFTDFLLCHHKILLYEVIEDIDPFVNLNTLNQYNSIETKFNNLREQVLKMNFPKIVEKIQTINYYDFLTGNTLLEAYIEIWRGTMVENRLLKDMQILGKD